MTLSTSNWIGRALGASVCMLGAYGASKMMDSNSNPSAESPMQPPDAALTRDLQTRPPTLPRTPLTSAPSMTPGPVSAWDRRVMREIHNRSGLYQEPPSNIGVRLVATGDESNISPLLQRVIVERSGVSVVSIGDHHTAEGYRGGTSFGMFTTQVLPFLATHGYHHLAWEGFPYDVTTVAIPNTDQQDADVDLFVRELGTILSHLPRPLVSTYLPQVRTILSMSASLSVILYGSGLSLEQQSQVGSGDPDMNPAVSGIIIRNHGVEVLNRILAAGHAKVMIYGGAAHIPHFAFGRNPGSLSVMAFSFGPELMRRGGHYTPIHIFYPSQFCDDVRDYGFDTQDNGFFINHSWLLWYLDRQRSFPPPRKVSLFQVSSTEAPNAPMYYLVFPFDGVPSP